MACGWVFVVSCGTVITRSLVFMYSWVAEVARLWWVARALWDDGRSHAGGGLLERQSGLKTREWEKGSCRFFQISSLIGRSARFSLRPSSYLLILLIAQTGTSVATPT
jgi:hypothetical protein